MVNLVDRVSVSPHDLFPSSHESDCRTTDDCFHFGEANLRYLLKSPFHTSMRAFFKLYLIDYHRKRIKGYDVVMASPEISAYNQQGGRCWCLPESDDEKGVHQFSFRQIWSRWIIALHGTGRRGYEVFFRNQKSDIEAEANVRKRQGSRQSHVGKGCRSY